MVRLGSREEGTTIQKGNRIRVRVRERVRVQEDLCEGVRALARLVEGPSAVDLGRGPPRAPIEQRAEFFLGV